MANRLIEKIEISGSIILKTGLHIGGTNSSMSIGGIDKSVIRNPINNQPYIPGSSLKGKMRSLFEIAIGEIKYDQNAKIVKNAPADSGPSADLFGNPSGDNQKPSRLIVRDGYLINHEEILQKTDMPYTEGKTEVVIDRITSAANPRQMERVPAGAKFSLNLILNIWENDGNREELIKNLFESLMLLKDDYLGGNGSRGYGQIGFMIKKMVSRKTEGYYNVPDGKEEDILSQYQDYIKRINEPEAASV
ncbi:MAG: type III-A CRISPR-associated RAMP protein Csm3 [Chitinophagales bacterium]|nr:MAG: type III-A CRISPR-associated RAMP protein Csm3 [Chitinophagales bacterium]